MSEAQVSSTASALNSGYAPEDAARWFAEEHSSRRSDLPLRVIAKHCPIVLLASATPLTLKAVNTNCCVLPETPSTAGLSPNIHGAEVNVCFSWGAELTVVSCKVICMLAIGS